MRTSRALFFAKIFADTQIQQNINLFTDIIKKDTNSRAIRTLYLCGFKVIHRVVVDAVLLSLIMQVSAG